MTDVFSSIVNGLSTGLIGYIVPFLFVLTLVVFIHELGHFLVARWCGIKVLTFSIGFGPELFGFNDRHGTRWKLAAIPLGGYVKFFGDDSEASTPSADALQDMSEADRKVSFHHKPVAARAAVVVAGPVANFLLAIVIFAALFTINGKPNKRARVDVVQPGSAAARPASRSATSSLSINGRRIATFADMQRIVVTERRAAAGLRGRSRRRPHEDCGDAGAARGQGRVRQCPAHRAARHQPQQLGWRSRRCTVSIRSAAVGSAPSRPGS